MMNNTTLGDLIEWLEKQDQDLIVKDGFGSPHSDRGDYSELAFTPAPEATISDMLMFARSAVGATFTGWKGGDFRMEKYTPVYIGEYGTCGEPITPTHFKYWLLTAKGSKDAKEGEIFLDWPCLKCGGNVGHLINCPDGLTFSGDRKIIKNNPLDGGGMGDKAEEIEEKWGKEFELDWDIHKQRAEQIRNEYLDLATIKALCRIRYFQGCHEKQKENLILPSECERLEARIKELLARQDWYETIIKELESEVDSLKESRDYWKRWYEGR